MKIVSRWSAGDEAERGMTSSRSRSNMRNRDLEKVVRLESFHGLGSTLQPQNLLVVEVPNGPRPAQEL